MKLLVFSDIHNDRRALESLMAIEADHYACAGDLVNFARGLDAMAEIMKPRADKLWLLPGNHETERDIDALCERYGFQPLHGRSFEAAGVHIAGLGYSNPTPFDTPGEYSETELASRLQAFSTLKPLVLICHAPPRDTELDGVKPGAHFGSTAVRAFLDTYEPVRFFCGHIHECEGRDVMVGHTRAVNAGKRGYLVDLSLLEA